MTSPRRYNHFATDDYAPPTRSLSDCASTFYDQAEDLREELYAVQERYDLILARSSRLLVLHPNSVETPSLALDLRDTLVQTASTLKSVDSKLYELWESEERVRIACEEGTFSIDGLKGTALNLEVKRREDEMRSLIRRFKRRCRDLKSEARSERDERREIREERKESVGVADYLEGGLDCPDLTRNDLVHASRFVVTNPFTILAKLLDNFRALQIPDMIATERTPATFIARPTRRTSHRRPTSQAYPSAASFDDSVRTAARRHSRPLSNWKDEILRNAPSTPTPLHRVFDDVSNRMEQLVAPSGHGEERAKKEKWIIVASLIVLPVIALAMLVQTLVNASTRSSSSSASSTTDFSSSSHSFTSLFPTKVNQDDPKATGVRLESQSQPNMRRRESFDFDSQLV